MLTLPFFERLAAARSVLIAGAGGGFDVYAGLPLYFTLRERGVRVHLASLSFANLDRAGIHWPHRDVAEVDAAGATGGYFPERLLSQWFAGRGDNVPIYAFRREGVRPTLAGYEFLRTHLDLDAVVLVDGGSDSLMKGDEFGLGSPEEDFTSIAAVSRLDVPQRYLLSIGFGVDFFHRVCHAQVLRAVAELTRTGGYLGAISLLETMPAVAAYLDAVDHAHRARHQPSIVSASISSAIRGHFGDHHTIERTGGSTLFINPLMGLCWCFDLPKLAERVLFLDRLMETEDWADVSRAISRFRLDLPERRPWEDIPC